MKKLLLLALTLTVSAFLISSCDTISSGTLPTGTMVFNANGEGFVHEGFVSEDGWTISFDHVYVNLEGPTAYQVAVSAESASRHAGHDHGDVPDGSAHSALTGQYFVDLKRQGAAEPVFNIGSNDDVVIGNYNYLNFSMVNIDTATTMPATNLNSGDTTTPDAYEGYCLILIGTAVKGSDTVTFTIKFDQAMKFYECGPQEDLDEDGTADGILSSESDASTQMTFHFDHIFGDFDEGDPEPSDPEMMSFWGIGFGPFAEIGGYTTGDHTFSITQEQMRTSMNSDIYFHLYSTLMTLGHLGEGHCHCSIL